MLPLETEGILQLPWRFEAVGQGPIDGQDALSCIPGNLFQSAGPKASLLH